MNASEREPIIAGLVDELRQVLDALQRDDVDQLLRPILQRAEALAAQHVDDGPEAEQLLADLTFARTLLTGGVIT